MEQFLLWFRLQSGMPLGLLLAWAFWAGVVVVGLVLARRGQRLLGVLLTVMALARLTLGFMADSVDMNWNPTVSGEQLTGLWQDPLRGVTLELYSDDSYRWNGEPGTWKSSNCNLSLSHRMALRVVQVEDSLRLIEEVGDPDCWDGHLGFQRAR